MYQLKESLKFEEEKIARVKANEDESRAFAFTSDRALALLTLLYD